MTYRLITSFGPGGWELYARRMVESYLEHWDIQASPTLAVYYHDCELPADAPKSPRLRYVNLNAVSPEFVAFREHAPRGEVESGKYNFRFDAYKFSAKVFALAVETQRFLELKDRPRLVWLDADTYATARITKEWLDGFCPDDADFVHLPRDAAPYSETSFVLFDLRRVPAQALIRDLLAIYVAGEIFQYKEWHDGFIVERLLFLHAQHGAKLVGLTPADYKGLEAFENSVLGERMVHLKGNRKTTQGQEKDTPMFNNRYDRLDALVKFYAEGNEHFSLLETGTWNGDRAIRLARAAFAGGAKEVHYDGFDLFEEADAETDAVEMNTKKHWSFADVTAKLAEFAKQADTTGYTFSFSLHKGDSKTTLTPGTYKPHFAYLDGGHTYETAKHDWEAVVGANGVVVFDDFFVPDATGKVPPENHCGTNAVYAEIEDRQKYILPSKDPVLGGGVTCLAVIVPTDMAKPPAEVFAKAARGSVPLKVQARDCMPQEHIETNVRANLKLVKRWIKKCEPHSGTMVVASGGPSLVKEIAKIKKLRDAGAFVMAVKHALPMLADAGIVPDGLILLDPRDAAGISTHGKVRTGLFDTLQPETRVFLASMSDPSVTKLVKKKTNNIWGWHAYTESLKAFKDFPPDTFMITGGTCAAWRAVPVGKTLGFDKFHLFGFDFSYQEGSFDPAAKDDEGRNKYFKVGIGAGRKEFWSSGELIAAAQDAEHFFKRAAEIDIEIYCYGEGIGPCLWKEIMGSSVQQRANFHKSFNWSKE